MSARFIINFTLGLHLISAWGGAAAGGYEAYNNSYTRYFSKSSDDFYTASARGLVRGAYYPYNTITRVPQILISEKPPWV